MAHYIVAPQMAALNASGSATVESVIPAAVAHADIEYIYKATVDISNGIFTAFDISDNQAYDGSANFTINLDESAFTSALAVLMAGARGNKLATARAALTGTPYSADATGADLLKETLDREIKLEVQDFLNKNAVSEFLEGDAITGLDIAIDYSGGATNMYTALNTVANLRSIFLQLPNRKGWNGGADTDNHYEQLPVVVGDEISFVFNLDAAIAITEAPVSLGATGSGGSGAPNSANQYGLGTSGYNTVDYNAGGRRVQFVFTVA